MFDDIAIASEYIVVQVRGVVPGWNMCQLILAASIKINKEGGGCSKDDDIEVAAVDKVGGLNCLKDTYCMHL